MAEILAMCDTCDTVWGVRGFIGGAPDTDMRVDFQNVGMKPCPNCGGSGSVPDGEYRLVGDVLSLARGYSVDQLSRLVELLRQHRHDADVLDRLEEESPQLANLVREGEKRGTRRRTILGVLLSVLLFLAGPKYTEMVQGSPPTVEEIMTGVRIELERARSSAPGSGGRGAPAHRGKVSNPGVPSDKVPRNSPCSCGSGLKYKHCHGAPPGAERGGKVSQRRR